MNDHLPKPVNPEQIHKALLRWLPGMAEERSDPAQPAQEPPLHPDTESPGDATASVFSEKTFMARIGEDRAAAAAILSAFCMDIPGKEKALGDAIRQNDAPEARRLAHTIKGAGAAVSAARVVSASGELEKSLQNTSDSPQAPILLSHLRSALRELMNHPDFIRLSQSKQ